MNELRFELKQFSTKEENGRLGTVGPFGEVTVVFTRKKWRDRSVNNYTEVRVHGENMPGALYRAAGRPRPGLKDARLLIDGVPVGLDFNKRAFRNKTRALKLTCQGRTYEYTVTGVDKGSVLRRTGMEITITRDKSTTGKGHSSFGTVTGEADGVDLALAIVFEEVDTFDLTSMGAATAAFNRIVTPRTTDSGVGSE
ncbi:hypothetical protein OG369_20960 [Streptomyces sp. NBC_01221]|uniref:hypothetical protein n=1 Tax=Streptomyces sp. NBC_01221 TaxID=2903782 RepID=UPI0022559010|nr:hypothetical protein [Streptomyces sp. NBC_01221]MCX4788549.1 hypothetical protein [Streptomyces sp. NBC_01221]